MESRPPEDASDVLRRALSLLRAQRPVLIAAVLVGALGAFGLSIRQEPRYEAEAQLQFNDESSDLSVLGIPAAPSLQPQKETAARAEIVESDEVIEAAAKRLRRRMDAAELRRSVSTRIDPASDLVTINVTSGDGRLAADAAQAVAVETVTIQTKQERKRYAETAKLLERRADRLGDSARDDAARVTYDQQISRLLALSTFAEPVEVAVSADTPDSPVSPKPLRNTVLGGVLGFILGLVGALFRNTLDRRLRSADEVQEHLDFPVVGLVSEDSMGRVAGVRTADRDGSAEDLEAFWLIRSNLDLVAGGAPRVIAVTSGLPEEGKSTVAGSLAMASAASGKTTLLVETDLRRPTLAGRLGLGPGPGLVDYLSGRSQPQEVVRQVLVDLAPENAVNGTPGRDVRLACIFAGSETNQAAQLLASKRFDEFIAQVSQAYDCVVLDTCPLLPVVDTREILPHVDATLVCVRAHQTTRNEADALRSALDLLPDAPMGVVITGIRRTGDDSYYAGGYAYSGGHAPASA